MSRLNESAQAHDGDEPNPNNVDGANTILQSAATDRSTDRLKRTRIDVIESLNIAETAVGPSIVGDSVAGLAVAGLSLVGPHVDGD